MLRRLEDRGQIRGGRFVSGFGGEQFALPEVVDSLRAVKDRGDKYDVPIAGADPLNLIESFFQGSEFLRRWSHIHSDARDAGAGDC